VLRKIGAERMNKIGSIDYRKINRISPSQFYSMKNCAYKSLLAEAFEKKPLLPVTPNAYLGTVLHKILELIAKKEIKTEQELNARFNSEVLLMEADLNQKGYGYFVPLQMNVRDFGLKQIQLKKHLRNAATLSAPTDVKFTTEKWFESKDKLVGGKIDLVIELQGEAELIDFKTGAITEDVFDDSGESYQEVKSEYQEQLKLYAYLFFDSTGKFPTQLSLVDLTKQKFNIEFSQEDCNLIFEQAKELLRETNRSVDTLAFKAVPNEANCKYCLYRPACSFYSEYLLKENRLNDVCGLIQDVIQYQNGNVSVFITKASKRISVTGFTTDQFEYFNNNRNKQITLFNLRKEATEFVYSATKTTKIYEY